MTAQASRHVRDFARLDTRDQVCFMAAWSLLGLSRLAVALLPFTAVRRALGEPRHPGRAPSPAEQRDATRDPTPEPDPRALRRAIRIGRTVRRAARHTPWRSDCYPQALAARVLLGAGRIPHVVSFGVRRDGEVLRAHVWVRAGVVMVTGGSGESWTEVGSFSWAPRKGRTG